MTKIFKIYSIAQAGTICCVIGISQKIGVDGFLVTILLFAMIVGYTSLFFAYFKKPNKIATKPLFKMNEAELSAVYRKRLIEERRDLYYGSSKNKSKLHKTAFEKFKFRLQSRIFR